MKNYLEVKLGNATYGAKAFTLMSNAIVEFYNDYTAICDVLRFVAQKLSAINDPPCLPLDVVPESIAYCTRVIKAMMKGTTKD